MVDEKIDIQEQKLFSSRLKGELLITLVITSAALPNMPQGKVFSNSPYQHSVTFLFSFGTRTVSCMAYQDENEGMQLRLTVAFRLSYS